MFRIIVLRIVEYLLCRAVLNNLAFCHDANAVGEHARDRLHALATKYDAIGDVRGSGLIFGVELVTDPVTKSPASDLTDRIINEMRARGVILSKLGRHKNTLKIRPPMPFSIQNADLLCDTLDDVLRVMLQ